MKELIVILSLGISVMSCKKEPTPEPTPVPLPTTQYKLNFMAYDNPSGTDNFHTDVLVVVNGDTLSESLSQHLTNRGHEAIEGDFLDGGIPYPTNGLTYNFELNTLYNIKIIDASTKLLLSEIAGDFKMEPNPTLYNRDIYFDSYSIVETENHPNSVTVTGNSSAWQNGGMGEGNLNNNYFFTFVLGY